MIFPPGSRRGSGAFAENAGEIALCAEGQIVSDFRRGIIRITKHIFGRLNPFPLNIIHNRAAGLLAEQSRQITGTQSDCFGDNGQRQRIMETTVNIIQSLLDRGRIASGLGARAATSRVNVWIA